MTACAIHQAGMDWAADVPSPATPAEWLALAAAYPDDPASPDCPECWAATPAGIHSALAVYDDPEASLLARALASQSLAAAALLTMVPEGEA